MKVSSFPDLNLDARLLATLAARGFKTPTPVQAEAIPLILAGNDLLASAQTGSGKTAAFVLPILQRLSLGGRRAERGRPRALILAPTRELAAQIGEVLELFGRNLRLRTVVIYGGVGRSAQINALRVGVDVAVATPGRLLDLVGEGAASLDRVEMGVLDEADRMLDMGFLPDVRRIIRMLPPERQSLFFSATLPDAVVQLSRELLTNPACIRLERSEANVPRIDQQILFVSRERKRDALRMILAKQETLRALVFTRTKHRARDLSRYLGKNGIAADALHGDKSQGARTRALADFHSGRIQVLVATDIAARGIDVDDIDHVINFELPAEAESYVHRIGRTARAGKSGTALSLCDESEIANLQTIQKALNHPIPVLTDHPYHAPEVAAAARPRAAFSSRSPRRAPAGSLRSGTPHPAHAAAWNRPFAQHSGASRKKHRGNAKRFN